jgi:protein-disulfide isomerase-like protein with CxxC motif
MKTAKQWADLFLLEPPTAYESIIKRIQREHFVDGMNEAAHMVTTQAICSDFCLSWQEGDNLMAEKIKKRASRIDDLDYSKTVAYKIGEVI